MLAQVIYFGFPIGEVSCPTRYFEEASSINFPQRQIRPGRPGHLGEIFPAEAGLGPVPHLLPHGRGLRPGRYYARAPVRDAGRLGPGPKWFEFSGIDL